MMRKLLYALTIVGLLAAGTSAQQAGGSFIPSFGYDIESTTAWNFAVAPTVTSGGTVVSTTATQTLTNKTLTSPTINTATIATAAVLIIGFVIVAVAGGSTLTLTSASHGGKTILLDTAAGTTITLPAASGSGMRFTFVVSVAATSNQHRINVVGNDAFFGGIFAGNDTDNSMVMWPTAADADQINMSGTATGGVKGARIVIEDAAADSWSVIGWSDASGTEATPFATGQVS